MAGADFLGGNLQAILNPQVANIQQPLNSLFQGLRQDQRIDEGRAIQAQAAQAKQKEDSEALFFSDLTRVTDPQQRVVALQQGLESGAIDQDDFNLIANTPFENQNAAIYDSFAISGREALIPAEFRNAGKSGLASAKTETYPNGTVLQALPSGETQVRAPDGTVVTDPNQRVKVLQEAEKSRAIRSRVESESAALGASSPEVIEAEASKAEKIETKKLQAQFKLKPKLAAAVAKSTANMKALVDTASENRSNAKALEIYDLGIKGLADAMGKDSTGTVTGILTSFTDDAKISNGAIAAMAPILKNLFRASGEGTFTKDDQEILMAMLPSRNDSPKVRASKLANVDAIVKSKLATVEAATVGGVEQPVAVAGLPPVNNQGWGLMTDANGNKAYVGPNGEIEEVQ